MSGTVSAGAASAQASLAALLSVFSTAELVAYVQNLKLPTTFLLDTFFPNIVESDVPQVAIDIDVGKRRIAPFCTPLVEGKMVESRRWQTNLFTPAYIKDKRVPDLLRPVRRALGERLLGGMSPAERLEANLAFEMQDQIQMIERRLEWMAASALVLGSVTIAGDGYQNPVLVNFGRSANLSVALTGAAQWGQPGVSPTACITNWAVNVLQASGAVCTDIVFTNSPWEAFLSDIRLINAVLAPRSGDTAVEFGGKVETGAMYMGRWGQFRCWLYNEWFVDPVTDIEQPMISDGTVLLGGAGVQGTRAFGAIMDPKFNYGSLAYAPKLWFEEDPATINLMMQSSPIVIPSRVNASMAATVMAGGGAVAQPGF